MTKSTAIKSNDSPALSLIERAANVYGFGGSSPRVPATPATPTTPVAAPQPISAPKQPVSEPAPRTQRRVAKLDRALLAERGFIVPDAVPGPLAEEFRIVKRQLLLNASGATTGAPLNKGRMVLICSAKPDDGKTFCAVNLALSLAAERDTEVLLVDADVAKPEILSTLGIEGDAGLMDALSDPTVDIEDLIIPTDIAKFSVLGAGRATNDDTELLASVRTRDILATMAASNPSRIVIFDSAPALAASPASALALNVGQVVMVVRADRTTESELRDAVAMVDGCPSINLLLNGSTYVGGNHSFGSYYGRKK